MAFSVISLCKGNFEQRKAVGEARKSSATQRALLPPSSFPSPLPLVSASLIWYPRRPAYLSSSSRTISSISFCLNGNREPACAHTRDHTEFLSIFALIFSGCVIIASQSLSWTLITLWELRNVHTRKEKCHLWDSQWLQGKWMKCETCRRHLHYSTVKTSTLVGFFQLTLSNRIHWFLFGCDWLARRARARSRAWDTDAALFTACLASPAPSAHFGRLLRKILKRGQFLWVWKDDNSRKEAILRETF